MTPRKDYNNLSAPDPKDTGSCDLSDKKIQNSCFKATQRATRKHRKTIQQNQENNT